MLKTRLIPVLLLKNGLLVRSEEFSLHQAVGNPIQQVDRFNAWAVDELVYLDISRDATYDMRRDDHKVQGAGTLLELIEMVSRSCFMPLTFGGGIRTVEEAGARITHGADKVAINTGAVEEPELITEIARRYGSQAVVVSVDVRREDDGWQVYTGWGKQATGLDVRAWAREAEARGAGELLLGSIDRDGMGGGYDLDLIRAVSEVTTIPVIALGGVGRFEHLVAGAQAGASAVAAANVFHFTEHATQRAKRVLADGGVDVRLAGVGLARP